MKRRKPGKRVKSKDDRKKEDRKYYKKPIDNK